PGLNEETLLSIAISDVFVLILRPDHQDFQGTAVTVEVARKLNVPRMLMVVNKALPTLDFAALREQVEGTYHAPVAGVFPLSTEMLQLASGGGFCLHYPPPPFSPEGGRVAGGGGGGGCGWFGGGAVFSPFLSPPPTTRGAS